MFQSRDELHAFIADLRIPEARRAQLEIELLDHLESHIEVELVCGASPETAEQNALSALGDPRVLHHALELVEPAFELQPKTALKAGFMSNAAFAAMATVAWLVLPRVETSVDILLHFVVVTLGAFALLRPLAPRGFGAALRSIVLGKKASSSTPSNPRRAAATYLRALVWIPPPVAIALELLGVHVFHSMMAAYFILWFGFGGGAYTLRLLHWLRIDQRLLPDEKNS